MDRNRQRRPLYAPPPPPGRNNRQHSVLGYWVPLLVTGTIAIGGLAAWIWSERSSHDDEDQHYGRPDSKPPQGRPPPSGPGGPYPGPQQGGLGGPGGGQDYGGGGSQGGVPSYQGPIPNQSSGPQGQPPPAPGTSVGGGEAASYYNSTSRSYGEGDDHHEETQDQGTFFGQVRGAMRRTPSPQQFFDHASKQVSAGIAAAGSALGSIMEDPENGSGPNSGRVSRDERVSRERRGEVDVRREEREGFSDHERWSEEADEKRRVGPVGGVEVESGRRAESARSAREVDSSKGKGRAGQGKTMVAVVVSADTNMDGKMDEEDVVYAEHASILSHLPEHHNPATTDIFVLIYAPGLTTLPPLNYRPSTMEIDTASNLGSSYSQINTPAQTPGSELQSVSPRIDATDSSSQQPGANAGGAADFKSPGRQFDALYTTALTLVSTPSQILCFTTIAGYIPILRHLSPSLTYVSDLLAGSEGDNLRDLKGWVGQAILVVGDDGTGGLADTETEDEGGVHGAEGRKREQWWERSEMVGLGKGVEIVDAGRIGEDWGKRVGRGRE
ncbi:hypothetical protein LTR78_002407 [Recurvomyces mirabilis]|uniref:Uncharacterized protein n=1 Tax=Recurvomyces mirabilis TaxID=574656 RepID=A0AAE0WT13_9PEZI|nr:hypothetical protein LTR78_002407 [Recurvomyces mirabilis]KAK5157336.1 hypothetical protein LTS14_004101 [Recurvomyces mirabilis]